MKHIEAVPYQDIFSTEYAELQNNDSYDQYGSSGFCLADFLNQTSNTGVGGDAIDPCQFFDVEFRFFPGEAAHGQNTFLYEAFQKLYFSGKKTGKIATQISDQLVLRLGMYVQSMTIPQIVMPNPPYTPTLFGEFSTNSLYMKPDNNTFQMSVLNTKIPLHEYVFYPWMREATLPKWQYQKQPCTTANVYVSFAKHCNVQCVFAGARPSQIQSRQPTQEASAETTRDVTFLFDYMFVLPASAGNVENGTHGTAAEDVVQSQSAGY